MIGGLYGLHFYNSEAPHVMTKPSRVFWAIGLFGLIWNALGCFNFILQMDPGALAEFTRCLSGGDCQPLRLGDGRLFDCGFWWGIGLCFDAVAPGDSAAGFVSFACWRGADNGPCAMGGGCGAWGLVSGHFKRHVFGRGGWFGVVHASQGRA